jgi:hypothetical protein
MFLSAIYVLYTVFRSWYFYDSTTGYKKKSLWQSYKDAMFGNSDAIRLYHIIVMIIDIPALCAGYFYPTIKRVFTFKIYTFKNEETPIVVDQFNNRESER